MLWITVDLVDLLGMEEENRMIPDEIVRETILGFDWDDYGMDFMREVGEDEWANDLAGKIVDRLHQNFRILSLDSI